MQNRANAQSSASWRSGCKGLLGDHHGWKLSYSTKEYDFRKRGLSTTAVLGYKGLHKHLHHYATAIKQNRQNIYLGLEL